MVSMDESTDDDIRGTETTEEEEQRRSAIRQTGPTEQPEPQMGAIESEHERKGTPGGPGIYREESEES